MQGRNEFLTHVLDRADELLRLIEMREEIEPDLNVVRDTVEVLRDEIRILQ